MKASIVKVLALIIFVSIFSGCTFEQATVAPTQDFMKQEDGLPQNTYQILEIGFSDSIPEALHSVEYEFWNDKDVPEPENKTMTFNILGVTLTGEFVSSSRRKPNNYATYEYEISGIGTFEVGENGKITGFCLNKKIDDNLQSDLDGIDQDKYRNDAIEFMQKFVNTDEYQIESEYIELTKGYLYTFTKYIGEQRTAEQAKVCISYSGEIFGFYSYMLGRVPTDTEFDFDYKIIEEEVFSKLNHIYADTKQYCSDIKYTTIGHEVTILENGEVALLYYVRVTCAYEAYGYQFGLGDIVSFVITKNTFSSINASK